MALTSVACSGNFDTTRVPRPYADKATLGQEIFGVLCDRVGAGALNEDASGASYRHICHPDDQGRYGDVVDHSRLPPVSGTSAVMRNLAVAKVEALARHRNDLIRAFDVVLPDVEIDDPFPPKDESGKAKPRKVHLHVALRELISRLNPLYDSNPLASAGASSEPLLPSATQSLARMFEALIDSPEAQKALAHIGGREGYRPRSVALGAIGPLLAYPHLRSIAQHSVRVLQPGGPARGQFLHLLDVVHHELRTAERVLPLGPYVVTDPEGIAQPNRPRDNLEILQSLLLTQDPAFAHHDVRTGLIVLRDHRGFAHVTGTSLGLPGAVPAPFADRDRDGLADVDEFGRFVQSNGELVPIDLPFHVPGEPRVRAPDALGRALFDNGSPAYEYIDTTQTLTAALLRDIPALIDPDEANDREVLMDALAGAYVLFGDRVPGQIATYGDGKRFDSHDLKYTSFDPETSPLVDLVYAVGQILADPQSDDFLQQLIDLFENHEQLMARIVGLALELKRISDEHPEAKLPAESTLWDEIADVITDIAAVGDAPGDPNGVGLLEDLLLSFTDERASKLGPAYAKMFLYKDKIGYNPDDINGPVKNWTSNDARPPHVMVDRSAPSTGENRSLFQRSLQIIYDTTDVKACNRANAIVHLKAGVFELVNIDADYPEGNNSWIFETLCTTRPLEYCEVFEVGNLAHFYLQALIESDPYLPAELNKKKATIVVKDACLNKLASLTDMDDAFEQSSGIQGLTTHPTHTAMARLVFFGADAINYQMPDLDPTRDTVNAVTNAFLADLMDPIGTPLCPKNSFGVNVCSSADDTLRVRDAATLFSWEHFDFNEAMRPLLYSFYKHDREDLFTDLVATLHRHMADSSHGPECSKEGSWRKSDPDFNPKYCAEDGLVRYEPMLSKQLSTDILPAAIDLLKVARDQRIPSSRYRAAVNEGKPTGANLLPLERRGTEVMTAMTRALIDSNYARQRGIIDRFGQRTTLWSDGVTKKSQVTPYDLLANALKRIDERFASAKGLAADDRDERLQKWRKARSRLVDQFMAVDGTGTDARFRNPVLPKTIVRVLKILREQLNARCPNRERGEPCTWASHELAEKTAEVLRSPLFAAIIDLAEVLRADPGRIEIEKLVQYLLTVANDDETLRSVLASSVDLVQVLRDGQTLPPIFNVVSSLSKTDGTGCADIVLQLLNVLSRDPDDKIGPDDELIFDRYHVLDHILPNLTKPIYEDRPSKTALEVFVDVTADVHRYDSSEDGPLSAEDYKVIGQSMRDFLISPNRGMEQLYTVVRDRDGN